MQTKDLVSGTDYDYRSSKHSRAQRVTVRAVNVSIKGRRRGYYAETVANNGVEVTLENGHTVVIKPSQIIQTWAEYEAATAAAEEYARQAAERQANLQAERASLALAVHTRLVDAGVKPQAEYVSNYEGDYDALVAAGFRSPSRKELADQFHIDHLDAAALRNLQGRHLMSALDDLSSLMDKGTVPLSAVATLLGLDAEAARRPEHG